MNKHNMVECFYDSLNISEHILKAKTKKAIKTNKVYKENFIAKKKDKNLNADFVVESNTSFNAAKEYLRYGKTAVLNFANPHNPAGGVHNGAMAQEECLCRSSNLYPCISDKNVFNDYYLYHRNMRHYFFSDRLIYTKGITVFKDDSDVPQIMPEREWFQVDVITCAAPYIAKLKYTNKAVLKELFKGRIKNIFETAIDNDVEVIILGAFGCGAFKNPPAVVAKAFHEVIDENNYKYYFKKLVFAIKSTVNDDPFTACPNIMAFEMEFYGISFELCKERFSGGTPAAYAYGDAVMPSDRIHKAGNDFLKYYEWKSENEYYGKQFSILGDSISTLSGYNPKGYKVFFDGEICEKSDVKDMKDTWWGKVIDFFRGELLVNNSWSGSRVTRLPNSDRLFPSGCSDERTNNLHINSIKPDLIIIYLGTNDWAFDVDFLLADELKMQYFSEAYRAMLGKITSNYPKTEIWCCTLNTAFMSSNPSFVFPFKHKRIHIEEYNKMIKDSANQYNCKIIDLYSYHIPYNSIDGSHPNADGMNTLAAMMIREIGGKEVDMFMDCEDGQHKFGLTYEYDQNYNGGYRVCEKCGKKRYKLDDIRTVDMRIVDTKTAYMWNSESVNIDDIIHLYAFYKSEIKESNKYSEEALLGILEEALEIISKSNENTDTLKICENDQHEFMIAESYCGTARYVCKKCGKVYFQSDGYNEYYNFKPPSKCSKCQGEFEMTGQNGDYDYYTCKSCGNHICVNPFAVLNSAEFNGYQDVEYVHLPLDITRVLYENTIRLYDIDTKQHIEMPYAKFNIGSGFECELYINNENISKIHASFYYENQAWFVMDNDSMNGTWLNGRKLEQNKKYELYTDDIISFAKIKNYVFFKSKIKEPNMYSEKNQFEISEGSLEKILKSNEDIDALKIIALTLANVPIYFPIDHDFNEMSGNIDPTKLKAGNTITTVRDVKMKILTLEATDKEIVPMFTSAEQAHNGPDVNIIRLYPQNYLSIVISMNKSIVLNPFGENAVCFKPEFLKEIVLPFFDNPIQKK